MADRLDDMDLAALTREAERLGYVRGADSRGWPRWLGNEDGLAVLSWSLNATVWWSAPHRVHDDEAAALRWLLRTDEAQARAACYARGVADGRAQVIADVRGDGASPALAALADALERGDHEAGR